MVTTKLTFSQRGGWWLVAQVPILLGAALLPLRTAQATGFVQSVQLAGAALTVIGIALVGAGLFTLGRSVTPFPHPRDGGELRTQGIYAWIRHPVYSGLIFAALGWALAWMSPFGMLWALVVAIFFDRKAVREERWLSERFPEYADYARRVHKFIPGVY